MHPSRVAGVVLCAPTRLDPAPFEKVAGRLLMLAGDRGLTTAVTENAAKRLAGSRVHILNGYEAVGWSDVAADRTAELATAMRAFLEGLTTAGVAPGASVPRRPPRSGVHAGVSYRNILVYRTDRPAPFTNETKTQAPHDIGLSAA